MFLASPLTILNLGTPATLAVDFFEAVIAWLKADTTLTAALAGGIHGDEAPARTVLPYAVVSEPDSASNNESEGKQVEPGTIQVSIFATGKASARAIRRLLVTSLQDAPLVFSGGALLHLRNSTRSGMMDPDRGPGGCDVWQEIQMFDAVVGRG